MILLRADELPPLQAFILVGFTVIGIVLQTTFLFHTLERTDHNLSVGSELPIASLIIINTAIFSLFQFVKRGLKTIEKENYKYRVLNLVNEFLYRSSSAKWFFIFSFLPVYLIAILILMIFGQSPDSLIKAFTETTTWRFSQHSHPDYLPHQGHYLCTVAAHGSPKIVKPLREGKRHGRTILVNRQLLIANAFEDLITEKFPRLHGFIRRNYDKYGIELAEKIKTPLASNVVFILMKPLEWLFLATLYFFDQKPEARIDRQYR